MSIGVFSFDFGLVNFLDFACTCAWSNSQLSSIRTSFAGFVFVFVFVFSMASSPPTVLILGHSFVRGSKIVIIKNIFHFSAWSLRGYVETNDMLPFWIE